MCTCACVLTAQVRTKIDQDIDNNAEQGIGKAETMRTVRAELEALVPGTTRVYLVSSRLHNRNKYVDV